MDAESIIRELQKLPTRYTARTEMKAAEKIKTTAAELSPLLFSKGLQIAVGGSSPSTQKTIKRVYLERAGVPTDHNPNNRLYHETVVETWEWLVRDKYGFHPLSAKKVIAFCDDLLGVVQNA